MSRRGLTQKEAHAYRVAVIHHYPVVRLGIVALLQPAPDVDVVAHGDSPAVIPRGADGQPRLDVLIMAAQPSPDEAVWQVARELADRVPILVIAPAQPHGGLLEPRAGVFGRIHTDVFHEELVAAIRAVAARQPYPSAPAAPTVPLSRRERQVLALIAQGLTHHQVARRMGIAKPTVDTYVARIRGKLRLGNKAELTLAAVRLVEPSGLRTVPAS